MRRKDVTRLLSIGGARNFNVPPKNVEPSAADVGLTRKEIHEARQIRDAEVESPGIRHHDKSRGFVERYQANACPCRKPHLAGG
jgi:hypothetical protein